MASLLALFGAFDSSSHHSVVLPLHHPLPPSTLHCLWGCADIATLSPGCGMKLYSMGMTLHTVALILKKCLVLNFLYPKSCPMCATSSYLG